jgi:hypothetical protein
LPGERGRLRRTQRTGYREDETAENIHTNSKDVDRFTGILYPETVEGVIFERFSPVGLA